MEGLIISGRLVTEVQVSFLRDHTKNFISIPNELKAHNEHKTNIKAQNLNKKQSLENNVQTSLLCQRDDFEYVAKLAELESVLKMN